MKIEEFQTRFQHFVSIFGGRKKWFLQPCKAPFLGWLVRYPVWPESFTLQLAFLTLPMAPLPPGGHFLIERGGNFKIVDARC